MIVNEIGEASKAWFVSDNYFLSRTFVHEYQQSEEVSACHFYIDAVFILFKRLNNKLGIFKVLFI